MSTSPLIEEYLKLLSEKRRLKLMKQSDPALDERVKTLRQKVYYERNKEDLKQRKYKPYCEEKVKYYHEKMQAATSVKDINRMYHFHIKWLEKRDSLNKCH